MDAPVQHTVLAEIPATSPEDSHSTKKVGLHQPRPSPYSPTSVTSCATSATTPRPPAAAPSSTTCTANGQDAVFGSGGSDGFYNEGESGCFDHG
jgi:hypothetical protein